MSERRLSRFEYGMRMRRSRAWFANEAERLERESARLLSEAARARGEVARCDRLIAQSERTTG